MLEVHTCASCCLKPVYYVYMYIVTGAVRSVTQCGTESAAVTDKETLVFRIGMLRLYVIFARMRYVYV